MANVEKMTVEFERLLKKYESASAVREWQNYASGNTFAESEKARKQEIAAFKKRFEAAANEEVTPEA